MSLSRSITSAFLALVASAWAACPVVLGLWFIVEAPRALPIAPPTAGLTAIAMIAAGNLVFMYLVADRVFPSLRDSQTGLAIELFTLAFIIVPLVILGGQLL